MPQQPVACTCSVSPKWRNTFTHWPLLSGWLVFQPGHRHAGVLALPLVEEKVETLMPRLRHTSATGTPDSACCKVSRIWLSVNFDFFMGSHLGLVEVYGSERSSFRRSLRLHLLKDWSLLQTQGGSPG